MSSSIAVTRRRDARRTGLAKASILVAVVTLAFAVLVAAASAAPLPGSPDAPVIQVVLSGTLPGEVFLQWSAPFAGNSLISSYAFSESNDGGTTWSAITSFHSTAHFQSSTSVPALACANITPGSLGCEYRIYAVNNSGPGAPSKAIGAWIPPSAPIAIGGIPLPDFGSVAVHWPAAKITGGLPITYDVLGAMDGGATSVVGTTSGTNTVVPCFGALSCTYRVRARNSQGNSAVGPQLNIVTAPGVVTTPSAAVTGVDLGSGISTLHLSWAAPGLGNGLPPVSYEIESCLVGAGKTTGCESTSTAWSAATTVALPAHDPDTLTRSCQSGVATCEYRVRGRNARGGVSAWHAFSLQPWTPFGVTVARGRSFGFVTVTFQGPAESGAGANSAKRYRVYFCTSRCSNDDRWFSSGLNVLYPPTGAAPFTAGSFFCHGLGPHPTCQVRMRFVDGLGRDSSVSAIATGTPRT